MKRIILMTCILFSTTVYGQSKSSIKYPTINDLQHLFYADPEAEGFRRGLLSEELYRSGPNKQIQLIKYSEKTATEPETESIITVFHNKGRSYKVVYETSSEQEYLRLQESVKARRYKPVKNKPQEELEFEKDVFRVKFSQDQAGEHPYTLTLVNLTRKSQLKN